MPQNDPYPADIDKDNEDADDECADNLPGSEADDPNRP